MSLRLTGRIRKEVEGKLCGAFFEYAVGDDAGTHLKRWKWELLGRENVCLHSENKGKSIGERKFVATLCFK
jgi:hypothetical protein